MKKALIIEMVLILIIALSTSTVCAQSLLGKRYGYFEFGIIRPGDEDIREIDDSVVMMETGVNY